MSRRPMDTKPDRLAPYKFCNELVWRVCADTLKFACLVIPIKLLLDLNPLCLLLIALLSSFFLFVKLKSPPEFAENVVPGSSRCRQGK